MIDIKSISAELKLGDNGIWYTQDNQSISYPSEGNESCFLVEDHSFWFKHRNNCIVSVVKSYPPEDKGTIFDIGGGEYRGVLVWPGDARGEVWHALQVERMSDAPKIQIKYARAAFA